MNWKKGMALAAAVFLCMLWGTHDSYGVEYSLTTHTKNQESDRGKQLKFFVDQVAKRTNGKVKIKVFWGEGLVTAKEALEATAKGICNMNELVTVYYPDKLPIYQISVVVPFVNQDPVEAVEIGNKLMEKVPAFRDLLENKYNQVPLWGAGKDNYDILSNKPIRKMEDMKGLKIGGFGKYIPKWLAAAGATPVSISAGELYTAFQRGTIDGRVFGFATVKQFGLQDVAKYMCLVGFGSWPLQSILTVNKDTWKKMSPETQKVILEVSRETEKFGPKLIKESEAKIEESFKKGGMQMIPFPPAERQKWKMLPEVQALPAMWVKEVTAKGFPGQEIMDMWLKLQNWR